MSVLLLSILLMIFLLFIVPLWLWLHYGQRKQGSQQLSQQQRQRLIQLKSDVEQMQQRIDALEAILDEEHPNWRQH